MHKNDFPHFSRLVDDVHELRCIAPATPRAKALMFDTLQAFPIHVVEGAIRAHLRDPEAGRYTTPLQPAHVIAQIDAALADDGRPGPEEAWSLALRVADEDVSGIATAEVLGAFAVCRPIFDLGDKVGARMAFRQAYERQVKEARQACRKVEWIVSLGMSPTHRAAIAQDAVRAGRLTIEQAKPLLLAAPAEVAFEPTETGRRALAAVRDLVARMKDPSVIASERNARERKRFDEAKAASEQRVSDYQAAQQR